jgi:hypothetical protein
LAEKRRRKERRTRFKRKTPVGGRRTRSDGSRTVRSHTTVETQRASPVRAEIIGGTIRRRNRRIRTDRKSMRNTVPDRGRSTPAGDHQTSIFHMTIFGRALDFKNRRSLFQIIPVTAPMTGVLMTGGLKSPSIKFLRMTSLLSSTLP